MTKLYSARCAYGSFVSPCEENIDWWDTEVRINYLLFSSDFIAEFPDFSHQHSSGDE